MKEKSFQVILLLIYLSFSVALSLSCSVILFILLTINLFFIAFFVYAKYIKIYDVTKSVRLKGFSARCSRRKHQYFFIVLGLSLVYWLSYYPGSFNLDAYGQWSQAHGELPYNDWHPITSTLILQLILTIRDSFSFYIFIQILLFSYSVGNLLNVLQKNGVSEKKLSFIALFIGLSPSIGLNTISLTKDAQFTILILNLMKCYIEILFSKGYWLNKTPNLFFLGVLSGLTILVRHNGVLYVIPSLILLLLFYKPYIHRLVFIVFLIMGLVFIIKVPLFQFLSVEAHENPIGESVGVPMAILGNAIASDADELPEEIHVFLNTIASDSDWKANYIVGEWDSCKWAFGGTELLKNVPLKTILKHTFNVIKAYPEKAYESIRQTFRIVIDPFFTSDYWKPVIYIETNDYGISSRPIISLNHICEQFIDFTFTPGISIFIWNTGLQLLLIIIHFIYYHRGRKNKGLILLLPLFIYDIGTMLLLTGPNQRYFYSTAVLYLPIIASQKQLLINEMLTSSDNVNQEMTSVVSNTHIP